VLRAKAMVTVQLLVSRSAPFVWTFYLLPAKIRSRRADSNRCPNLITNVRSVVAGGCRALQNPHFYRGFLSPVCSVLHRIALPMVLEWYQEAVDYTSLVPTHYEFSVYVPPQRLGDAGAYQKENRSSRSLLLRQPVAAKKSSLDSAK